MYQEKIKQSMTETFKLLWQFKWYILPYIMFYIVLISFYLSPSPKQYNIWINEEWFVYNKSIYLALTKLMLVIFLLLFLIGTSNMRNHPQMREVACPLLDTFKKRIPIIFDDIE